MRQGDCIHSECVYAGRRAQWHRTTVSLLGFGMQGEIGNFVGRQWKTLAWRGWPQRRGGHGERWAIGRPAAWVLGIWVNSQEWLCHFANERDKTRWLRFFAAKGAARMTRHWLSWVV